MDVDVRQVAVEHSAAALDRSREESRRDLRAESNAADLLHNAFFGQVHWIQRLPHDRDEQLHESSSFGETTYSGYSLITSCIYVTKIMKIFYLFVSLLSLRCKLQN